MIFAPWLVALVGFAIPALGLNCQIEISLFADRVTAEHVHNFSRDAAVYLANALASRQGHHELNSIRFHSTQFPEEVAKPLAEVPNPYNPTAFFAVLKQLSTKGWYNKTRTQRLGFTLPENQSEFLEQIGFDQGNSSWRPSRFRSIVKPENRIVFRSLTTSPSPGFPEIRPKISLATSLRRPFQDEVEVIIQRSHSPEWDFYVYREGKLTNDTQIRASAGTLIEASAPYACLACHYNPFNRNFSRAPVNFVHGYSDPIFD